MWMVKNVLRGTICVNDLNIRIPPKEYFDLDSVGRARAEASRQLRLAFEEGYLQNISKGELGRPEAAAPPPPRPATPPPPPAPERDLSAQMEDLKRLLIRRPEEDLKRPIEELRAAVLQGLQTDTVLQQLSELKRSMKNGHHAPAAAVAAAPVFDPQAIATAVGTGVSRVEREIAELKQALKPPPPAPPAPPPIDPAAIASAVSSGVGRELDDLRRSLQAEAPPREALSSQFAEMRSALVRDLKDVMRELAARRSGGGGGGAPAGGLSEAELKLRLASLEEQERSLSRNFDQVGKKELGAGGTADIAGELMDAL